MAGLITQGVQIIGTWASFSNKMATDLDYQTLGWQIDWAEKHLRVEPQLFREKGTDTAAITFTEEVVETLADTFQVEIIYEIHTSG